MAKRLFVGSLSYDVTQGQLEELFATVGTVESATLITDKYSGQSKGFGFVEMSTDEESAKAITELNGKELSGRSIVVNEARPREERPAGGGFGGGGGFRDRGPARRR
jgi:cold-inducible RNA-binding protein